MKHVVEVSRTAMTLWANRVANKRANLWVCSRLDKDRRLNLVISVIE